MISTRPVRNLLQASAALALLLAPSLAVAGGDPNTVQFDNKFGIPTGPTSVGEIITDVNPGERFMYVIQTQYECFCSGYTTSLVIEFPDSVVPVIADVIAPSVQVVDNTIVIANFPRGGFSFNFTFDLKAQGDLPPGTTEVRFKTSITANTPSGTYTNMVEDVLPLAAAFTATLTAAPAEVQLTDPNAVITLTVTFKNIKDETLNHVAPFGDPVPSIADAVELTDGPTPPSVDPLEPQATGSLTYTFKPKKGGAVRFSFDEFLAESPSGVQSVGPAQSNEVKIKEDVTVDVAVEPSTLVTNSSPSSTATIRVKTLDPQGRPVAGQDVALDFPQYFGIVDQSPRLLICKSDGTLVYPPGASPTLLDVDYAVTGANAEVTYQLRLGTQQRTPQLLVTAAAIDENRIDVDQDGVTVGLTSLGGAANPGAWDTLDALQLGDLPESLRGGEEASIVPPGSPFEVLRALVSWFEEKREQPQSSSPPGLSVPQDADWVPITTYDDAFTGLMIYDRSQTEAVIAYFFAGGSLPTAWVLQIELVPGAGSRARPSEVKWKRPWIALEDWGFAALDDEGLVIPNGDPPRGHVKLAIDRVTSDPYAFLGYPYPAASGEGYGASCVPRLNGVTATVHSQGGPSSGRIASGAVESGPAPATLLVKDAQGRALGFDAGGAFSNAIPGAVYVPGPPAKYMLPPGSYQTEIVGTAKGAGSIVLSAPGAAPKTFTLKTKPGKTGTLAFDDSLGSASGTFNKKNLKAADGVPIAVTGVKKKIKVRSGDPLTLTVTSAFGDPVAGARVHATGSAFDAETLTGVDGVATIPLIVTKATKKLTVTVDGAGVQPKTLKLKVKLLKS